MKRLVLHNRCVGVVASILSCVCAACLSARVLAQNGDRAVEQSPVQQEMREARAARLQTPVTEPIDIAAQPTLGNRFPRCHLAGSVTLWISRSLRVLDDLLEERAVVEAGLLQFGKGSTLEGCSPDSAALDLSDQFANFLVTEGSASQRETAMAFTSQLAQDFFHLAQPDRTLVPLVNSIKASALGSVACEYTIVLIHDAKSVFRRCHPP